MNDFTLEELKVLANIFTVAAMNVHFTDAQKDMETRVNDALAAREELENMDLDDCTGGACKL